jgi:hypothetical protein
LYKETLRCCFYYVYLSICTKQTRNVTVLLTDISCFFCFSLWYFWFWCDRLVIFSVLTLMMARQVSIGNSVPRALVAQCVFFHPETCTMSVRVHNLETQPVDAHMSTRPDYCVMPYDVFFRYAEQFPDITMQTTRIKTIIIENLSHSVVGRVMLKLFIGSFAMRVEFLLTAPTRHSTTHRIILGKDFVDSYLDSPFTDRMLRLLLPFSVFISCKCAGAYCHCPQHHVVVRRRCQTYRPYY